MIYEVCEWEYDPSCGCDLPPEADDTLLEEKAQEAAEWLHELSGWQFPACPVSVRPCSEQCKPSVMDAWPEQSSPGPNPYIHNGRPFNASFCGCDTGDCGCSSLSEILLPGSPISEIVQVLVDGLVVSPLDYRFQAPNRLVRIDGGAWPACQDLAADPHEVGTFEVTYLLGKKPTRAANYAHSVLTCELVKQCIPGCKCRLPDQADVDPGYIGIPEVDRWLDMVNPGRPYSRFNANAFYRPKGGPLTIIPGVDKRMSYTVPGPSSP